MPATIFGDEFTVNQETVNAQVQPQITTLADGRLLFTWASTDPDVDGDGYGVSARIGTLQPDGSVVWGAAGEITVNEDVASTQQHTQVTVLGDGRVLFTWASTDPDVDGDSYGISARIGTVQADGSIAWDVAGEITVNQEIASTQQQPQVTALADGRMLFTWMSFDADVDGDGYGISARIGTVLGDGSIVWDSAGELTVNEEVAGYQEHPQVMLLADGRVLLAWTSSDADVDGNANGIATRIGTVQADGSIVWGAAGETTVNQEVTGFQVQPQVIALADGRVLFTWMSSDPDVDGASYGVAARVGAVQADGSIVWGAAGEITVNEEVANSQEQPQVTVLADGRVLFVWISDDPDVDGSSYGIAARVGAVQADGSIIWDAAGEFTVNEEMAGTQQQPQVMVLADGRVLVTWTSGDPDVDGSNSGIAGRLMLLNASPDAQNDALTVAENATIAGADLFADNGAGADGDIDGDTFTVNAINGSAPNVGTQITLASGALLTVNTSGTFDYDPNGAFALAYGASDQDSFTYTIDDGFGGTSSATVTITVNSAGQSLAGTGEVDNLTGSAFGDIITGQLRGDSLSGGDGLDALYGGAGNDTLTGGAGDDMLDGDLDTDVLHGGDGDDTLYGRSGGDTLNGDGDTDTLYGGDGNDTLNGGDGDDLLDGLNHDDTMFGGSGADTLYGRQNNDTLSGEIGDDTLYGGDGDDLAHGGADNDLLDGGNHNDTLNGGDGQDELYGRQNNDTLNGDGGEDDLYGGDGDDVIDGGADGDVLDGGNHNDTLAGGDGDDALYGRQNNDDLNGNAGADTLFGGDSDDFLNGGDDADRLDGGNGFDTLTGGGGVDTFVISAAVGINLTWINDFSVADDTIELSISVFTTLGLGPLAANAFVIGPAATTADHRIIYDPATGVLFYDGDGAGAGAQAQIALLATGLALTEADFAGGP